MGGGRPGRHRQSARCVRVYASVSCGRGGCSYGESRVSADLWLYTNETEAKAASRLQIIGGM